VAFLCILILYIFAFNTAIKDGVCRIGLTVQEIEDLALSGPQNRSVKCSTRELSLLLAKHTNPRRASSISARAFGVPQWTQWGATTVASTMHLAHLAGIATFVTGGIGGVHRHGQVTLDISADLQQLSRTPVIVVSAGIKSILDIPRTLEVLETLGVPVVAYGTDEFPAFFSPASGIPAPERVDTAKHVAEIYGMAQELGLSHGLLVAVPNSNCPAGDQVEKAIQSALQEAMDGGITGRDVTPFVLKTVALKTHGESVKSNMALLERNTEIGADIAVAVARQAQDRMHPVLRGSSRRAPRVVVMGGIVLDMVARPLPGQPLTLATSNPALVTESDGGVGRNISEVLCRLGTKPFFYSAIGDDARGLSIVRRFMEECDLPNMMETVDTVPGAKTATYWAILNEHRDLHVACADMDVLRHIPSPPTEVLAHAKYLILDANPPVDVLRQVARQAADTGVQIFWDPTSAPKAQPLCVDDQFLSCLTYASPNVDELYAMAGDTPSSEAMDTTDDDSFWTRIRPVADAVVKRMLPKGAHLIVTGGAHGVLLASRIPNFRDVSVQIFPALPLAQVENATGAGDTLAGAVVHALLHRQSIADAVAFGIEAAAWSLQCTDRAISPLLSEFSASGSPASSKERHGEMEETASEPPL
jgi:pseudouridine-5'-phosphate glycosidase/sugar/nucleoside kinase (ribokinase family)